MIELSGHMSAQIPLRLWRTHRSMKKERKMNFHAHMIVVPQLASAIPTALMNENRKDVSRNLRPQDLQLPVSYAVHLPARARFR